MPSPRSICFLAAIGITLFLNAQAQQSGQPVIQPTAQRSSKNEPAVDDSFIQKQFGATCKLMPGPAPLTADLNGDGIEDVVIAARCTNPLLDEAENNYKVIDPYNTYFGYGDPKISTQFALQAPRRTPMSSTSGLRSTPDWTRRRRPSRREPPDPTQGGTRGTIAGLGPTCGPDETLRSVQRKSGLLRKSLRTNERLRSHVRDERDTLLRDCVRLYPIGTNLAARL